MYIWPFQTDKQEGWKSKIDSTWFLMLSRISDHNSHSFWCQLVFLMRFILFNQNLSKLPEALRQEESQFAHQESTFLHSQTKPASSINVFKSLIFLYWSYNSRANFDQTQTCLNKDKMKESEVFRVSTSLVSASGSNWANGSRPPTTSSLPFTLRITSRDTLENIFGRIVFNE